MLARTLLHKALAILGFLWVFGAAQAAIAEPKEARAPRKVLLIGALVSEAERVAQADLYAAVLIALRAGLEGNAPKCPGQELCFNHVDSYDDLIRRARMKQQISARGYLDSASMRSVVQAGFFKDSLSGYVGIQIITLEKGFALEALIFKESADPKHEEILPIRRKYLVAESGAGELVQLAIELGLRIAMGTDSAPVARLRHEASRDVRVGAEVTLDASPSQDYDFDRLYWHWTQTDGPEVLPPLGSVRSTWRFVASAPGAYKFELEVRDCADSSTNDVSSARCRGKQAARQTVVITAGAPPNPRNFSPELISEAPHQVVLSATCTQDGKCLWTQVEGPQVAPPRKDGLERSLPTPGLYRFELQDENRFGREKSTKTYLVAPPPVSVPDVPSLVFMGNSAVLDGTGSFDPLGDSLSYLWTVEKTARTPTKAQLAAACSSPSKGVAAYYVTTPSAAESTLRVEDEGTYVVALTVTARRKLEDRIVIQPACTPKVVRVSQRRFELSPLGGFMKWGRPDGLALGMFVGGSLALDAHWRLHGEQILYRHIRNDDGEVELEPLGGTRLLLSYGIQRGSVGLRPNAGFVFRGAGRKGEAWGPRVGYGMLFRVGNRFFMNGALALDYAYFFNEKQWHPSPDLSFAFGFTL